MSRNVFVFTNCIGNCITEEENKFKRNQEGTETLPSQTCRIQEREKNFSHVLSKQKMCYWIQHIFTGRRRKWIKMIKRL